MDGNKYQIGIDRKLLKAEYESSLSRFEDYSQAVESELSSLLKKEHIEPAFPIQRRVKTWESIEGKFKRYPELP
ncbi:MAG: hypothetical protein AAF223_15390, partial [Bacteroidota bacterium]